MSEEIVFYVYFIKNTESQSAFVLNNCDFNSDNNNHDMIFDSVRLFKKDLTLSEYSTHICPDLHHLQDYKQNRKERFF